MKQKLMRLFAASLLMTSTMCMDAQTNWNYTYDATGNRTQRTITTGSSARQKAKTSAVSLFPDDDIKAVLDGGHSRLKIETPRNTNAEIIICDLTGKELVSRRSGSETIVVDLSALRHGTYILKVDLGNEKKACKFNK